ncbi:MAG: hypothetical protein P8013_02260 [Candidatus Sulfobium sp.]
MAGDTVSFGAGDNDIWILKLDPSGNVSWQKTYGGSGYDDVYSIRQTSDGGYIVAGDTESFGAGNSDIWILKLDPSGNVSWQKTYGGSDYDEGDAVRQTSDGGYIVAGRTKSFGAGDSDAWILKLDPSGNISWQKTYGGSSYDDAYAIQQNSDGGYIVAGDTESFGAGNSDIWILKLDPSGNVSWQKTYGGSDYDDANAIQQTSDGGYIVAGRTKSFGAGDSDAWILKLDTSGDISWQKTYGGTVYDDAYSVGQTSDGGYLVAGDVESFGAGSSDILVMKLDPSGNISWQKTYGGVANDYANVIVPTSDGGSIVAGFSYSFGAGDSDSWLLKLDGSGNISNCSSVIGTLDLMVADTNSTPATTTLVVASAAVTPQVSSAIVQATSAANNQVCYAEAIPLPVGQETFTYAAPALAILNTDPSQAQPVGVGDVSTGGTTLDINIAVGRFESPVDIYFLLYNGSIDPVNIYEFTSTGLLQPISAGLVPWIPASTGQVGADLFGTIQVSDLPAGTYLLGVAVMPPGDQSLTNYYLWITEFTVGSQ